MIERRFAEFYDSMMGGVAVMKAYGTYGLVSRIAVLSLACMLASVLGGCMMGVSSKHDVEAGSEDKQVTGQIAESVRSATEDEASKSGDAIVFSWSGNVMPTQEQLEVAKSLGAEDSVLAAMRENGMDRSTYYHVVPAEAAQAHLSSKYGVSFKVTDAAISSPNDENGVRVVVKPEEGDFIGQTFVVYARWKTGQPVAFFENYLVAARGEEYAEYMGRQLSGAVEACPFQVCVVPELSGFLSVDDSIGPDTPINRIAAQCEGRLSIVFAPTDNMSESEFREALSPLVEAAAKINGRIYFEAAYLSAFEEPDYELNSFNASSYLYAVREERRNLCLWRAQGAVSEGVLK